MQSIQQLLDIMAQLRDPESGCPWDLKQSYQTIVPYTIEEAYEVADAIENGDFTELRDELGDLLFQVVFYAQLAKEDSRFNFADIVQGICDKMIRRHPHVFSGKAYANDEALHQAWEAQKREERTAKAPTSASVLAGVAKALPALMRAEKLQKRAARVGFDWPEVSGAIEKTREEVAEVEQALAASDQEHLAEEVGDLLFAAVNIARLAKLDAEQCLRKANDKFQRRFEAMEKQFAEQEVHQLEALTLEEWDEAWENVKALERFRMIEK